MQHPFSDFSLFFHILMVLGLGLVVSGWERDRDMEKDKREKREGRREKDSIILFLPIVHKDVKQKYYFNEKRETKR